MDDWYREQEYAERKAYEESIALQAEIDAYLAAEHEAEMAMYRWFYEWHCEMDSIVNPFCDEDEPVYSDGHTCYYLE